MAPQRESERERERAKERTGVTNHRYRRSKRLPGRLAPISHSLDIPVYVPLGISKAARRAVFSSESLLVLSVLSVLEAWLGLPCGSSAA